MPLGPVLGSVLGSALSPALGEGMGSIIRSIFADGTDGFYFDFSKTDRLFQATTGGALADDAGENIALGLDGSKWGGLSFQAATDAQAEQVGTNPNFASDIAGWGSAGSATVTWDSDGGNGAALVDITGAAGRIADSQVFAFTVGKTYRFRARIKAGTYAGQLTLRAATTNLGSVISPTGSYVDYDGFFVAGTTDVAIDISRLTANTGTFYVDSISIKEIPGNHGLQATAASQPKWQTGGLARFDGLDDNLLTPFVPGTANSLIAKVVVPATISATQIVIGGNTSGSRLWMGFNTTGNLVGGVGTDGGTTVKGTTDLRGTTKNIALVQTNSGTVQLYVNGVQEYSAAQNGTAGTQPLRVGASNEAGVAGNFFSGDTVYALGIKKATAAEIAAISNFWGTT